MRRSGRLKEVRVSRPEIGALVTLQNDDDKDPICFMQFDSPWLDRLSILRRGDRLTVIGQITTVENYGVTLNPCLASQLGSLAMLLAIRLASFLNDTDRS